MKTYLFLGLVLLDLTIATVRPQAPAPIVIQAANAAPAAPASRPAAPAASTSDPRAAFQLLQEMLTTNAETLKKQEATLATLDELEKAAEEIKMFSKRG
jgi:hypothetical protein